MRTICSICAAALLLACGSTEDSTVVVSADGGVFAAPSGQCQANETRACTCPTADAGTGTQACYEGYWLLCNCAPAYVPGNFDTSGECLPGRYEGTFSGLYSSGFSFGGLPVPVIAFDPFGGPGLALTLMEGTRTGGGEFVEYTVSDGYIKGNADGVFPIEGVINGSLNCNSKEFSGTLKGWYSLALDLGTDLNRGFFEGPVHAYYDASTRSFKNGTWDVLESSQGGALAPVTTAFQTGAFSPGQLVDNLGGTGDWSATYVGLGDGGSASPQADAGYYDAGALDAGP